MLWEKVYFQIPVLKVRKDGQAAWLELTKYCSIGDWCILITFD